MLHRDFCPLGRCLTCFLKSFLVWLSIVKVSNLIGPFEFVNTLESRRALSYRNLE